MNKGRLSEKFRNRTKAFAAGAIRLFVKLPKQREEVRVLGKQLLRSGASVAAHVREERRREHVQTTSSYPNWAVHCKRQTSRRFGWSYCVRNVGLRPLLRNRWKSNPPNCWPFSQR
jgi:hypothetical protein